MTEPRDPPALDETCFPDMLLTLRVMRLAMLWRTRLDRALRPHGMTLAIMRPLTYLTMLPNGATQSSLAAAMDVDCSALVRVLDLLEKQGLLARQPDTHDRRVKRLVLTPAGQARCDMFHQIAAGLEREDCQDIPPAQVKMVRELLAGLLTRRSHHDA